VLEWYIDFFKDRSASFSIPIGALRALNHLTAISNSTLLLTGDKGYNKLSNFLGLYDPHIAVDGALSFMVNFHAISIWFAIKGGFTLKNSQEHTSLIVNAYVISNNSFLIETRLNTTVDIII
jgi:hypothetical protein